jgi:hypothetical protein
MNRTFTIIIGLLFLFALAGFAYFFTPNEAAAPEDIATTKEYRNEAHGFALAYPTSLSVLEYTPEIATIGTPIESGIDGVAEVRVMTIEGEPGQSFMEAAARDLKSLCAADGPDASFSCTGTDSVKPFTSAKGAAGFEVYLAGELRTASTGAVTEVRKGPYYGFLLATSAGASKVLIVHAPLNKDADEADAATIRVIADSVSID